MRNHAIYLEKRALLYVLVFHLFISTVLLLIAITKVLILILV